jgi:hypothetical protein
MKKNIIVIFAILIGNLFAFAQRHEIGIQLGTSNLVGDIGKTKYLNPFPNNLDNISNEGIPFYGAIMYRMNFNPYQSLDLDLHIIMFSLMINTLKNIIDKIEDILSEFSL